MSAAARSATSTASPSIGIFGASLQTGNLGVSALGVASVAGLDAALEEPRFTLFDAIPGRREFELVAGDWRVPVTAAECAYSRRVYRMANLRQLLVCARLGLGPVHPMLRSLRSLDAILDISGGDSFADIYGPWRFRSVTTPKQLALALGVPLILLPQTYGPFDSAHSRSVAGSIVRKASAVWARDPHSYEILKGLLRSDFDAARHREGVDVAFGLPVSEPTGADVVRAVQGLRNGAGTLYGLNVSGLLYHGSEAAVGSFGLRSGFRDLIHELASRLLEEREARLLLVPHVVRPCADFESDVTACEALRDRLGERFAGRVLALPALGDPMQAKWVIGRCDWFAGARMHACIAALSQGIPTMGLAYSDKMKGVFDTAGVAEAIGDLRSADARDVIERALSSARGRAAVGDRLRAALPGLRERHREQFRVMASVISGAAPATPDRTP
ncbi:MAG: polysaccharide pyruvyl transferase family protein [Myxococcota bacterium]